MRASFCALLLAAVYPTSGATSSSSTLGPSSAHATNAGSPVSFLRGLRVGKHPGRDRLVFEFEGKGLPAWSIEYLDDEASDCASGDDARVAGAARLQIRFTGTRAHTDAGEPTVAPRRRAVKQKAVRELLSTCDFEGEVTWVAGLAGTRPYRVVALSNPSRLVIDITH